MPTPKIYTLLGIALLARDISELELALDLGYDPSLVAKVVRGRKRPSQQFMEDVARYLDASVEELF